MEPNWNNLGQSYSRKGGLTTRRRETRNIELIALHPWRNFYLENTSSREFQSGILAGRLQKSVESSKYFCKVSNDKVHCNISELIKNSRTKNHLLNTKKDEHAHIQYTLK